MNTEVFATSGTVFGDIRRRVCLYRAGLISNSGARGK